MSVAELALQVGLEPVQSSWFGALRLTWSIQWKAARRPRRRTGARSRFVMPFIAPQLTQL